MIFFPNPLGLARLVEEEYEVWNRFPFFPICSLYVDCSRWEWDLPQSCRINWPRCKTPHFSWVIHNNFKSLSFLLTCNRQIGSNSNKRVECHDQSCFYTGTVHANLTRNERNITTCLKERKKKKSAWKCVFNCSLSFHCRILMKWSVHFLTLITIFRALWHLIESTRLVSGNEWWSKRSVHEFVKGQANQSLGPKGTHTIGK